MRATACRVVIDRFTGEAAREIDWIEPAKKVFDSPRPQLLGRR
jgi:hypothetical protein